MSTVTERGAQCVACRSGRGFSWRTVIQVNIVVALIGCADAGRSRDEPITPPKAVFAGVVPDAPVARANWTVARAGQQIFAFYGLGTGKTHADIARDAHAYDLQARQWQPLGSIPVEAGRLASVAATVGGQVYLFGGYTVSAAGEEKSMPEVLRFDPRTERFELETTMPVPVDDSIALPWRDRWIVLVSGWHDTGNVRDVQVYDTWQNVWTSGTRWPGKPVFGHAGGIVGDSIVACDGVTSDKGADGRNDFTLSAACWRGELDAEEVGRIRWHALPPHPGGALYRAGAAGRQDGRGIVFAGGSSRPYNFDGVGYDGVPAQPSDTVFSYDLRCQSWRVHAGLPEAGMDFRGLIESNGIYHLFGGMRAGQVVSGGIIRFKLPQREYPPC